MKNVKEFDKPHEEQNYFNWMEENPHGFVLNTHPYPSTSFVRLHTSNCSHISKWDDNDEFENEDRSYTTKLVKVCSTELEELAQWVKMYRPNAIAEFKKPCEDCASDIEVIKYLNVFSEEIPDSDNFPEGSKLHVTVNRYERNAVARKECLEHYGYDCSVCGFNFEEGYGEIGKEFIHVHHLIPLSEVGEDYEVEPIEDMRPVCPNCHAMLHQGDPLYTIDEIKDVLN